MASGMSPCEGGLASFGAHAKYGYHRNGKKGMPGDIEVAVGKLGDSCTETCAKIDSHCYVAGFSHLDDCNRLTSFFECTSGCIEGGVKDKDFESIAPAYVPLRRHCVHFLRRENPGLNRCNAKSSDVQRLCPCRVNYVNNQ